MSKNSLADEIMSELTKYTSDISKNIYKQAEKLSKQAQKQVRELSPKKTGDYSKGWHLTHFKGARRFRVVVYNDKYQLTHLLENGFIHYPNGDTVKGRPHIDPVQEEINEKFYSAVCEMIEKEDI